MMITGTTSNDSGPSYLSRKINMKRLAVFGMVLLLVTLTVCACASQPVDQGGKANRTDNTNYRSPAQGGSGNGLF